MFNKTFKIAGLCSVALLAAACSSNKPQITDDGINKSVGHVKWTMKEKVSLDELPPVASDRAELIFIRKLDDDAVGTSANIAVNSRFKVSLQPGNYARVTACEGTGSVSVNTTDSLTNDLAYMFEDYNFKANKRHYFYVNVDDKDQFASVLKINKSDADVLLQGRYRQTHQVERYNKACPKIVKKEVKKTYVVKKAKMTLRVLFDTDKSFIKPAFTAEVKRMADFMKEYPKSTAIVKGHTDSRASVEYNEKLSQRRANAIVTELVTRYSIDASRLKAVGYGESRPIASNATVDGRAQNRRTTAVITVERRVLQETK